MTKEKHEDMTKEIYIYTTVYSRDMTKVIYIKRYDEMAKMQKQVS